MPYSQAESFETNGYDGIFTSQGSSQGTTNTSMSFEYPDPSFLQAEYNFGGNAVFQYSNHGTDTLAGIATSPNVAVGHIPEPHVTAAAHAGTAQKLFYPQEPFSEYNRLRPYAPGPYFDFSGSTAQGPGILAYQTESQYTDGSNNATLSPSNTSNWSAPPHDTRIVVGHNSIRHTPPISPPSPNPSQAHPIPRIQPSPRAKRTQPAEQTVKPGYQCPQCPKVIGRVGDLQRHIDTLHTRSPYYWRCLVCGHWEHSPREDKMKGHCYKNHGQQPGYYLYDTVLHVERDYQHEPKPSVNGKATRRPKKHL